MDDNKALGMGWEPCFPFHLYILRPEGVTKWQDQKLK